MNYRRMGKTGLKLSEISFGAWLTFGRTVDAPEATKILHKAYELGVNFFDNADVYAQGKAETVMSEAIRDLPREALVISSKVFWPTMEGPTGRGLSRKHIMESCHASLKRLGLDYLDLYFCHRYDDETPLDEVVRAMDDLVHQGKILYWGTSEWRAGQIANAHGIAAQWGLYAPSVEQPHYNMFVRQKFEGELVPTAEDLGFGLVSWSPLRSGLLTGKYNQGIPEGTRLDQHEWLRGVLDEANILKVKELAKIAEEMGVSLPQLAIGWLLRIPQLTSVITGASRMEHLEENLKSSEVVELLSPEILERIEAILDNKPQSEE
ncbi:MAG TPA: aldo/keto reductase [Anaerolineae bacterium]|nr:aldo/keto reductase [Anaerolineae bacterium]